MLTKYNKILSLLIQIEFLFTYNKMEKLDQFVTKEFVTNL
jgi:hypothetical protein